MLNTYQPALDLLQNRIILVTGASSGIGRTAAKTFATYGATVILLARSVPKLETLYDEIVTAGFPTPAIYPLNLATATFQDYQDLKTNIQDKLGALDGLLHNAGELRTLTPIEHYPLEQWLQIMQTNLTSAFLLTQAALPLLKKSKDASIVFTSAPEGEQGKAYWGAYGVSKFGLQGLMQTLSKELETNTNIRVNSINPVKVRTRLRMNAYPAENSEALVLPQEIMSTYLYLMGKDSQGIQGQTLRALALNTSPLSFF